MNSLALRRHLVNLVPDRTHVLARPFQHLTRSRSHRVFARVMQLPESTVQQLLTDLRAEFGDRQRNINDLLQLRYQEMQSSFPPHGPLSEDRQLLLGGYFTYEYALESAALFNPSIVPHPDQTNLPPGCLRFILSLRATAEGHISSIVFRTGQVDANGDISIAPASRFCSEPRQMPNPSFDRRLFETKLRELHVVDDFIRTVLSALPDAFTLAQLTAAIRRTEIKVPLRESEVFRGLAQEAVMLARSNYEVQFSAESELSERVLFPVTPSQVHGIEDARFVRFTHEDGQFMYYATCTAYDGLAILPQFIETPDFLHFKFITLNGAAVENKGMALFPRKVNGQYVMLGRQDAENLYIMFSPNLHFWHTKTLLLEPLFPWEFIQLGNCGSPIETDAGWLVITHGVGPMRRYCIGAVLLDRDNPGRVLRRLARPLIEPAPDERDGYVPNVVYSCGSLLHGHRLIIPYGISDFATRFASVSVDDVLAAMVETAG